MIGQEPGRHLEMNRAIRSFTGRVTAVYSNQNITVSADGVEYRTILKGSLLQENLEVSPIAVGDYVEFQVKGESAQITKILPRKHVLSRPKVARESTTQIMASNLDQVVIVSSTRKPRFKPGLIDRFLVGAQHEKLTAIVVINKIDLGGGDNLDVYVDTWNNLGHPTIFTSALTGYGLSDLAELLREKTSVLAGHSGVGKSSILNKLQPQLNLRTKEISSASGKGVHATTSVRMHYLDFGAWVIDTPGLKVLGLAGITRQNLQHYFPDISEYRASCRFDDCQHVNEPDCAVIEAVRDSRISSFRYLSYKTFWEQMENN